MHNCGINGYGVGVDLFFRSTHANGLNNVQVNITG
jgi:hypothetical protein